MKTYSHAPDADDVVKKIHYEYHEDLVGVTVSALFVFDHESSKSVLKHQGYPAGAVVRITPLKDRALGIADATIIIDRAGWLALSQRQRDALVDHELTHLTRKVDKESGKPACDVLDRPTLVMRRHDHNIGFFTEVAARHREAAPEVRLATQLMTEMRQLQFNFETPADDEGDDADEAKRNRKAKRASRRPPPKRKSHERRVN
jgi:hypothetical protein